MERKPDNVAKQLMADLRECDSSVLDSVQMISSIAREAVAALGAEIVEECVHRFEPIGVSYVAIISTSHFSIHTWPEYGFAAVDVFSCADDVHKGITDFIAQALGAQDVSIRIVDRNIGEKRQ